MGEVAQMLVCLERANGGPTKGRKILIVGRDVDARILAEAMSLGVSVDIQDMILVNPPEPNKACGPRNRWGALR